MLKSITHGITLPDFEVCTLCAAEEPSGEMARCDICELYYCSAHDNHLTDELRPDGICKDHDCLIKYARQLEARIESLQSAEALMSRVGPQLAELMAKANPMQLKVISLSAQLIVEDCKAREEKKEEVHA